MLQFFMPAPYKTGFLNSQTGHKIFYSLYGNPKGQPVLIFHGGPGSYSKPYHVGALNLQKYRVIMFDQPGSGKSEPAGSLKNNTTHAILEITEKLLKHLDIWADLQAGRRKLILKGRSWGATLALLFAIKHQDKIRAMLLQSIFMATEQASEFILANDQNKGVNLFLQERYHYIKSFEKKHRITLQQAIEILTVPDANFDINAPKVKVAAALLLRYIVPPSQHIPEFLNFEPELVDENAIFSMRVFAHYEKNKYFLPKNYLVKNADKLGHIPAHVIHARYDLTCPLAYTYELVQKLSNATLFVSHYAGHRGNPEWDKIEANWLESLA